MRIESASGSMSGVEERWSWLPLAALCSNPLACFRVTSQKTADFAAVSSYVRFTDLIPISDLARWPVSS